MYTKRYQEFQIQVKYNILSIIYDTVVVVIYLFFCTDMQNTLAKIINKKKFNTKSHYTW